jgi:hypothetical protein
MILKDKYKKLYKCIDCFYPLNQSKLETKKPGFFDWDPGKSRRNPVTSLFVIHYLKLRAHCLDLGFEFGTHVAYM